MRVVIACSAPSPGPGAFAVVTEDEGGYRFVHRTPRDRAVRPTDLRAFLVEACKAHQRQAKRGRKATDVVGGRISVVEIKRVPVEQTKAERLHTGREGFWSYSWFLEPEPVDYAAQDKRRLLAQALREAEVMPWEKRELEVRAAKQEANR